MSFLDDKCIAFDGLDENKLEHTVLHNVSFFINGLIIFAQEFKKLVENLLDELISDLGVT